MCVFRNNIDWCVLNRVVFGEQEVNFDDLLTIGQTHSPFTGGQASFQWCLLPGGEHKAEPNGVGPTKEG